MLVRPISKDQHPCCISLPSVSPLSAKGTCTRLDLSSDCFVFRQLLKFEHKYLVAYRHIFEKFTISLILTTETIIIRIVVVILIVKYVELKLKTLLLRSSLHKPIQQSNKVNFPAHLIVSCFWLITIFCQVYCRILQFCYHCCQQQHWLRLLVTIIIIILQSGLHQIVILNVCFCFFIFTL